MRFDLFSQPSLFGESAVDSYTPLQLQDMNRRDSWFAQGAGDLVFRTERRLEYTTYSSGRGRSSSSVRERIIRYGFLGIDDVAEIEATGGIPYRALDQAIACCNALHGVLPYAVDDG